MPTPPPEAHDVRCRLLCTEQLTCPPVGLCSKPPPSPTSSISKSQKASAQRAQQGFLRRAGKYARGEPLLLRGKDPMTVKVSHDIAHHLVSFEATIAPRRRSRIA